MFKEASKQFLPLHALAMFVRRNNLQIVAQEKMLWDIVIYFFIIYLNFINIVCVLHCIASVYSNDVPATAYSK